MTNTVDQSGLLRPMLRLAMPVLAEQLLNMLVGLVDTWLAGRYLEQPHLAAIGLMSYVLWLLPAMFAAVAIGATALVSRFTGARDRTSVDQATHQAFVLGALAAVLATLVAAIGYVRFIDIMQLQGDARPLALHYTRYLLPVIPAIMIQQVGVACLHGAGDTVTGLVVMTIVNVVNVAISTTLVIGLGPAPQLGWTGLAIGTATAHVVGAVLILAALIRGRAGLSLRLSLLRPDWSMMRRLLRIGVPGGLDMAAILFCHLWYLSIINALGTVEAAAHGLGVRIESLAFLPGSAFQVAAATLAGQALGAGDPRRASRGVWLSVLVGGSLMCAAALAFFFAGDWLTRLFLGRHSLDVARLTVPLLKIVAFSTPPLAVAMILFGGLRGAGDTRGPLAITITGLLVVRIPLAYWFAYEQTTLPLLGITLPGLGLSVIGAWYAMLIDTVVRTLLTLLRFWRGKWRELVV
ncbi:MAG: MATE family efflux transporter [Planctomycetales bacterium]|nr:MATE family efflux transporter [Planctomycetales bacterium]